MQAIEHSWLHWLRVAKRAAGRIAFHAIALLCVVGTTPGYAADGDFPNKPVRLVVPYAPGGTADIAARLIANSLGQRIGQQVVVENKPGAGGTLGLTQVLQAPADGYTVVLIASGYEWLPQMYSKLGFDPAADFAPVALIGSAPYIFITHPSRPYASLGDFIKYAKSNKGSISYATAGVGTLHHLLGTLLQGQADIKMTAIPYGGAAPAEGSLLGGQVDVMFDPIGLARPQIKGGRAKPLASTGAQRSPTLPDVPTFAEQGVPLKASFWLGLAVRTGVNPAIVRRLNEEVNAILREPAVRDRFTEIAFEADPRSPAEFGTFLSEGMKSWGVIVRDSGIKPE